jgi:iron(III) transport system substrate-binding protein
VERAKQEGIVVLYTSLAPTESKPLAEAFEKKYGIKVELWRALSDKVVQRAVTEAQARKHAVDVVETNGPEMEMLAREKLLAEFHSPYIEDLPKEAIPAHRTWFPDRMNFFVVGYNTAKVQRSEIPATYEGFTDPKWRGRIGLEATDAEWMATLIKTWGDAKGHGLLPQALGDEARRPQGHVLLAELVAAGEVPVGAHHVQQQHRVVEAQGRRRSISCRCSRVAARPQGIGVARNAPHRTPRSCLPISCCPPRASGSSSRSAGCPRARR